MNNQKEITYIIKSKINGKYLSNLFEDDHESTFQSSQTDIGACYHWNVKEIAERIATKNNGTVETIEWTKTNNSASEDI